MLLPAGFRSPTAPRRQSSCASSPRACAATATDIGRGGPAPPNGTMTNGAVGQTVSSVDGPVLTVKYRDGEKKIIVEPSVPVTRLEVANKSELKSGVAVAAAAATKKPDGTFTAARIDFGRGDVLP
jgi:hypothetical protein